MVLALAIVVLIPPESHITWCLEVIKSGHHYADCIMEERGVLQFVNHLTNTHIWVYIWTFSVPVFRSNTIPIGIDSDTIINGYRLQLDRGEDNIATIKIDILSSRDTWPIWCSQIYIPRWGLSAPGNLHIDQGNTFIYRGKPEYRHTIMRMKDFIQSTMMTSSNGNILCVAGHLCVEFIGYRIIPRTKASDAELKCFLWSVAE